MASQWTQIPNSKIWDEIETLLDTLGIEKYMKNGDTVQMPCPIHGGDNPYGFALREDGLWTCWTHKCQQGTIRNFITFIEKVLKCHKVKAVEILEKIIGGKLDITVDLPTDKSKFNKLVANLNVEEVENTTISKETIKKLLKIPADYYVKRGFKHTTLSDYYVGECTNPAREFYKRIVVPVFNNEAECVGCTARSIFEQCEVCEQYHDKAEICPIVDRFKYCKWKHQKGFRARQHLYGINHALPHIKTTGKVFLVEGPADVWRMNEAGFHNALSIFGCNISVEQISSLESMPELSNIVLLLDSDEAGREGMADGIKKLAKSFNIFVKKLSKKDPSRLEVSELQGELNAGYRRIW